MAVWLWLDRHFVFSGWGGAGWSYACIMRVRMLYFGMLKELLRVDQEMLEVPAGTTVEGVLSISRLRSSNESEIWKSLAVAINREYAQRSVELREGDEVALLPPVSGGLGNGAGTYEERQDA